MKFRRTEKFCLSGAEVEDCIKFYEDLIDDVIECHFEEVGRSGWEERAYQVKEWLKSTDFYDAPASTRFHESHDHGLLLHTLKVYNEMVDIIKIPKFSNVPWKSAVLACIVHDWCKIGLYEKYIRNVKNNETGEWEPKIAFKYRDVDHPFGHGVASMYMAMKIFELTEEEALAIRWHQGKWHCNPPYDNDMQTANENFPLVHLVQFADQLAMVNF